LAVSATVFEILTLEAKKSLNFSDLPFFAAKWTSAMGRQTTVGWRHLATIWRQQTRVLGLPEVKKS